MAWFLPICLSFGRVVEVLLPFSLIFGGKAERAGIFGESFVVVYYSSLRGFKQDVMIGSVYFEETDGSFEV